MDGKKAEVQAVSVHSILREERSGVVDEKGTVVVLMDKEAVRGQLCEGLM